jgi:hypothetical protein
MAAMKQNKPTNRKQEITSKCQDMDNLELPCIAVGISNGAATMESRITGSQKIKHKITICPSDFNSGYKLKS